MRLLGFVGLLMGLVASSPAADWPQWRGPDRTGISTETGRSGGSAHSGTTDPPTPDGGAKP